MPRPKKKSIETAKELEKQREASEESDAVKAMNDAKKTASLDADAKKEAVQKRLKPVSKAEINMINSKILWYEDEIDAHKDVISKLKTEMYALRGKRKEMVQGLKSQKKK